MRFWEAIRYWTEIMYFASGIVTACVALLGLRQIALLKKDIQTRNERAAKEKAIEFSERFGTQFIPDYAEIKRKSQAAGIVFSEQAIGDFTKSSLSPAQVVSGTAKTKVEGWAKVFNELEAISVAFVSGVADEELAFGMLANTFCSNVRENYDLLCYVRFHPVSPLYPNIVKLYGCWADRLSKLQLKKTHEEIESKLSKTADRKFKTIGM